MCEYVICVMCARKWSHHHHHYPSAVSVIVVVVIIIIIFFLRCRFPKMKWWLFSSPYSLFFRPKNENGNRCKGWKANLNSPFKNVKWASGRLSIFSFLRFLLYCGIKRDETGPDLFHLSHSLTHSVGSIDDPGSAVPALHSSSCVIYDANAQSLDK